VDKSAHKEELKNTDSRERDTTAVSETAAERDPGIALNLWQRAFPADADQLV
jgi:hypothetical protein